MLGFLAEVVLYLFWELLLVGTGHAVLWAVTLGRWRPYEGSEAVALLAGVGFWVTVAVVAVCLVYR